MDLVLDIKELILIVLGVIIAYIKKKKKKSLEVGLDSHRASLVAQIVKNESTYNAGDQGSVPGLGRSPGEGNGYMLQYPCLGNPTDRGAWRVTVHGVPNSWTGLSNLHLHF